jgi:chromate reductase
LLIVPPPDKSVARPRREYWIDAALVLRRQHAGGLLQQLARLTQQILEAEHGLPQKAAEFKALLGEYLGVFIASPEYNSSITPLLKNTIDWVTRVRAKGETGLEVYKTRVFAISGASPGYYGAMRSLLNLRQILEVGIGATVIPQQLALPRAGDAFEADGSLNDQRQQKMLTGVVEALAVAAKKFAA